jgi:hypothetical protein
VSGNLSPSTIDDFQVQPIGRFAYPPRSRFYARHEDDWTPWILRSPVRQFPFALDCIQRACWHRGGWRGLGCKRQDVDAFTSHIHLMRPPSGGLFVCAGPFAFATPQDDGAPPTNGGRRGFASFARGPAWNRMCQIAPTVGLACCKLLPS